GPYLLKEWIRGSSMTFVRNPDYWQKGKPYLDELDIIQVPDDTQRAQSFTSGGVLVSLEGIQNIPSYQAMHKFKFYSTSALGGGWSCGMNVTKAPFTDLRVRQALSMVIDSADFVVRASHGDPKTAAITTIDRKGTPFYNPKLKLPKTDPVGAQKLID